ncbi:MAG TPA: hypothetical protein VGB89_12665 [Bacteroidota bacterium]
MTTAISNELSACPFCGGTDLGFILESGDVGVRFKVYYGGGSAEQNKLVCRWLDLRTSEDVE